MVESAELDVLLKDPKALMERMDQTEVTRRRRELGTQFRTFVIENFGMERYLREHEQQLWLGAFRCAERRVEAMTVLENVCVRQCNHTLIRHMRSDVIPLLPSSDNILSSPPLLPPSTLFLILFDSSLHLGKAQDLPLYDLYADAQYRMIETAMEKNKQNFVKDLANRNLTHTKSVRTIAPFRPLREKGGIPAVLSLSVCYFVIFDCRLFCHLSSFLFDSS